MPDFSDFPRDQRKESLFVTGAPSSLPDTVLFPLLEDRCSNYLLPSLDNFPNLQNLPIIITQWCMNIKYLRRCRATKLSWNHVWLGASISGRRESLTPITHHFLLELMLTEYFENSNQHIKISKCIYIYIFLKALSYGLYVLFLKIISKIILIFTDHEKTS